ncbi:MAG: MBL fold metallo-hydrolase [Sporomusaceae bacterium]|jgi:7,8-dihydropterin-6-yl-methyl-4-(beta-D-ribofuranosyl)aminobenzene 5'-phosphate synthase|nr:MBL fold metallo-hydrolase [Sporomusaceae bacterium]
MKITALVENRSACGLKTKHGLALYIETDNHKILFDLGPDDTLFTNAAKCGIDLKSVDTVIISHGHYDHGGALELFLKHNTTAKVFIQRQAFEKHYSKVLFWKKEIGLAADLQVQPQIILLDGDHQIDAELFLFTVAPGKRKCYSEVNDDLYNATGRDDFSHEQNLIVCENVKVLFMGCGHNGVVNILEAAAPYRPQVCIGGYHLQNPVTKKTVAPELLAKIAQELAKYEIEYYTCHCTGQKAYNFLAGKLPNMRYLSCGETLTF